MLIELVVRDLGVVEYARLVLGEGLIALTGETGAGKTMVVGALGLLTGGRADPSMVRAGAVEAVVEGRFVTPDGDEVVISRVVPASGRSRAYVDGGAASLSRLTELTEPLVEVATQHAHHRLLRPVARRDALDAFGDIDVAPLDAALARRATVAAELEALGGDERSRARELDLLRFQIDELDAAGIVDPHEDESLAAEQETLGDAEAVRAAVSTAVGLLADDDGAGDALRRAGSAVAARPALADLERRLVDLVAEVDDVAAELRSVGERSSSDPERLDEVVTRRRLLADLCRKYGDDLAGVMDEHRRLAERLATLESHDQTAARLGAELARCDAEVAAARAQVAAERAAAAPALADAVTARLGELALGSATLRCEVAGDAGQDVSYLLAANPGEPHGPIDKAASGGELARVMLALHLVLAGGAPTMVFDEVDAGVGGAAGTAVGRALATLADGPQVLVVTHLPQVAAFADQHLVVTKHVVDDRTRSEVTEVADDTRAAELARMLAGRGDSETARHHAGELLAEAIDLRQVDGGDVVVPR